MQFIKDALLAAASYRASCAGNNAVGTLTAAAVFNLYKSACMVGKAVHGKLFKCFTFLMRTNVNNFFLLAVQHLHHVLQNRVAVAGTGDNICLCNICGFFRECLRVAAGQNRHGAGIFPLGAAKPFAAFLITEIGYSTAVYHIHIGGLTALDHGETVLLKQLRQSTGLILIYFTTQGIKGYSHDFSPHLSVFSCYFIIIKREAEHKARYRYFRTGP